MQPDQLTYQWLVPQLIGFIGGMILLFLAIIGWVIRNYLSSMKAEVVEMKVEMKNSGEEIRKYFEENGKKHHAADIRMTKIEEHLLGM